MTIKHIFWGLLFMVLASIGWRYKNAEAVQNFLHPQPTKSPTFNSTKWSPQRQASPGSRRIHEASLAGCPVARKVGGMRKCKKGREVIYTDGDCPTGSKELGMNGGSLTVVQSPSDTATPEKDTPRPNVRNLLVDPEKRRRIAQQAHGSHREPLIWQHEAPHRNHLGCSGQPADGRLCPKPVLPAR